MRFRRRSNVTDIEVARRAASGLGAYDNTREDAGAFKVEVRNGYPYRLYTDDGPLATVTELSASSVAEEEPGTSLASPQVEVPGRPISLADWMAKRDD